MKTLLYFFGFYFVCTSFNLYAAEQQNSQPSRLRRQAQNNQPNELTPQEREQILRNIGRVGLHINNISNQVKDNDQD